jgi:uncharacterized membrane protein SirB2
MPSQIAYWTPFVMAGLLLFSIATAVMAGGRANWLTVALVALLLALMLFRRALADRSDRRQP